MEKEEKNQRGMMRPPAETEFILQWGTRKRLRCVRIRSSSSGSSPPHHHLLSAHHHPSSSSSRIRRQISSTLLSVTNQDHQFSFPQPSCRLTRVSETAAVLRSENLRGSPEKEERLYTTRGSPEKDGKIPQSDSHGIIGGGEENGNNNNHRGGGGLVWPKLYISLSSKEKEEDFMAMKGCKLPQRPKKRAKMVQRTLLLVSPGAWLTDMSVERYEVREKKTSNKRARGLKAMGSIIDSDSD